MLHQLRYVFHTGIVGSKENSFDLIGEGELPAYELYCGFARSLFCPSFFRPMHISSHLLPSQLLRAYRISIVCDEVAGTHMVERQHSVLSVRYVAASGAVCICISSHTIRMRAIIKS